MSLAKLTASMNASLPLSMQRNKHKPSCSNSDHIIDFQMEILDKLYPNIQLEAGPKRNLFGDDNDDIEEIKEEIVAVWGKYGSLLNKIKIWRYLTIISIVIILSLIAPNIIAYFMFIDFDIDTQNDNSCSLFVLIYEMSIIIIIGWPLIYLRIRSYYSGLTQKWRNHFINNMVILLNNNLATKYSSKQWVFEVIYPIRVQKPKQYPQCWCYIRILANNDEHDYTENDMAKQPMFATSKLYDGETHLVMDFDLYLKEDRLGINIINGKKRWQFQHEDVVEEIGEFIMNLRIKYKSCILRISWLLLIIICFVILSIPWLVCSGLITGKATVDNKNFDIEIYIIVGASIISAISFVVVTFCSRKWLFKLRKKNFVKKIQNYMNNVLSKKYPNYAYSIIYPKNEEKMWCQLRISDHVLKCRADDEVIHTTYNDRTSVSIRNTSFGNQYSPIKSPLLQLDQ